MNYPIEKWVKDLNRPFIKDGIQRPINMQRCSTSLIIREIHSEIHLIMTGLDKV
jgi:hypothetical protein